MVWKILRNYKNLHEIERYLWWMVWVGLVLRLVR